MIAKGITTLCLLMSVVLGANAQKIIKADTSHSLTLHIDPSSAMGGNVSGEPMNT